MAGRRNIADARSVAERLRADGLAELEVTGPLEGGETGAFGAQDEAGVDWVFKWSTDRSAFAIRADAHEIAEALRHEAGWPLPVQRLITLDDLQVIVMDRLGGANPRSLDIGLIADIAALDESRRNLASRVPHADRSRFGTTMVTTLTVGGDSYCRHEPLRSHSTATRRLERRMVEIGQSHRPGDFPVDDLVHFDLHGENVLVSEGRLTGIVDPEFSLVGDGGFDLVTLAICAREFHHDDVIRRRAWQLVDERVDPALVAPYAAHILLRCADWEIRSRAGKGLDPWLDEAERLLFT